MKKYDAVIIGFGKGGKTLAAALGAAGKETALIEQSPKMYGGTCPNVGCVPTKSLVYRGEMAVHRTDMLKNTTDQQTETEGTLLYNRYREAIEQKNALTARLREKNYQKLANQENVTVIDGTASFDSAHVISIEKDGKITKIEGEQIFINTGASAFLPPIPGISNNPFVYTSETLLDEKNLPKRMVIVGGGYIGVEFSSIYANFGTKITILQDGDVFLPREDADIAEAVLQSLAERGVEVLTGVKVTEITDEKTEAAVLYESNGKMNRLAADALLIATGRRPNTDKLKLENAGIETNARGGILTDEKLMTNVPGIYAMGDVTGGLQFTYISLDDNRIVRSQVLGDGSYTLKKRGAVPYSVFLTPPFSRVGMSESEARKAGYEVKIAKLPASAIVKAQVLEQPTGLLKAVIDERTGKILGAHLFCAESHELINQVKLVMDAGLPYTILRDMIFTHPSMAEALNDLFAV